MSFLSLSYRPILIFDGSFLLLDMIILAAKFFPKLHYLIFEFLIDFFMSASNEP